MAGGGAGARLIARSVMTECVAADANAVRSPHERSDMRGCRAGGANPGLRFAPSGLRDMRPGAHQFLFTMSNSAVFFVPGPLSGPGLLLSVVARVVGWVER